MGWNKLTRNNYYKATPYCDNVNYSLLKKFIDENEIVAFKKDIIWGTTVYRFFENGEKSYGNTTLLMQEIYGHPFVDHWMFFKTKNGEVIFTSQPYTSNKYIYEKFNELFDDRFELTIYDTKESWYNPGLTILFTIKLKK